MLVRLADAISGKLPGRRLLGDRLAGAVAFVTGDEFGCVLMVKGVSRSGKGCNHSKMVEEADHAVILNGVEGRSSARLCEVDGASTP